jgi:tight adherence protein B
MDALLFPILIAGSVALVVWWAAQLLGELLSADRKKLKERLSDISLSDPIQARRNSIVVQMEAGGVSHALAQFRIFQKLYRDLLQAWPGVSLVQFLIIGATGATVLFASVTTVLDSLFLGAVAGAAGGYLPFAILLAKRARRQRLIGDQLPEALDFLGRILKAGHSFTTGIQMVSEELPRPLSTEFRRCYDQHSLGQPIEGALKEMAHRIESQDFAFFVTAVLIQRQTGGDLSEVLGNISGMIRGRIRLTQQVKAKTAEGRFTGYILVAFPAVMFVIMYALNPQYSQVLLHTGTGLMMLAIAIGLQVCGLWAIRRITTIRV